MKKTGHLCFLLIMLFLPAASNATVLGYFSGDLAPSSFAGAGRFDGSQAIFDVVSLPEAFANGAGASTSMSHSRESISGSGSATVGIAGAAASSRIVVPFKLLGGAYAPYSFSSIESIGPEGGDMFHNVVVALAISNAQAYLDTGIINLGNLLPASGYIGLDMLGKDEAFFIIANAIEVKRPHEGNLRTAVASYAFNFTLNPSTQVPEPPSIWLVLIAGAVIVFMRSRYPSTIYLRGQ